MAWRLRMALAGGGARGCAVRRAIYRRSEAEDEETMAKAAFS